MKLVLITAAFMAIVPTATAYQTEVDPQTMEWKREGLARWVREHKREMEREAQAALLADAAVEEAHGSVGGEVGGAVVAGCLSEEQVASYARGAGFPESVIATMVVIAYRESHYCPGAVNSSSGACGLWQMYPCPGTHALDPATNAAMAYAKYVGSGYDLDPWGY